MSGSPDGLAGIATSGFDFFTDDIVTAIHPESTVSERMIAGLFSFPAFKPAKFLKPMDDVVGGRVNKGIANPKTRLPRTNGKWEGEPGNGIWHSDKPEVKSVTNGEGVEFIDGRPNFTPWSKGSIKFKDGMLDGSKNDFNLVYEKIMQLKGFKSQNQAKSWLKQKGLTPHHKSSTGIELIPTDLHANIPHIGSASDLRGGKSK